YEWIFSKPNIIDIKYPSTNYLICSGGIINKIDIKCSFISYIDGISWHEKYGGAFGYVISNNPLGNEPEFYNFSCRLGSDNAVYAQEVSETGLLKTFKL